MSDHVTNELDIRLCLDCGSVILNPLPKQRRCNDCQDCIRIENAKRRYRKKANGVCWSCNAPAREGMVRCAECARLNAIYEAKVRMSREEAGKCNRCGKEPPLPGQKRCAACAQYARDHEALRRAIRRGGEAQPPDTNDMLMSEHEIIQSFSTAKNKLNQLKVLAEINCTDSNTIAAIVAHNSQVQNRS